MPLTPSGGWPPGEKLRMGFLRGFQGCFESLYHRPSAAQKRHNTLNIGYLVFLQIHPFPFFLYQLCSLLK